LIQFAQHFRRAAVRLRHRAQHAASRGHEQSRRRAFTGNIRQHQSPAPIVESNEIVPIATHRACGSGQSRNREARNVRRRLGQQSLLNFARLIRLTAHRFAFMPHLLKTTRIVNRNCHVTAQCLQQSELLRRKRIELGMRSRKHSNQLSIDMQRYRYLGQRALFAPDVVRIFPYIRRITHLTRSRHVPNHTVFANL
jgi:hypothetical protein